MHIDPGQRRFCILDRDGTLIAEKNYLRSVDQLELLPDAVEGLRLLAALGYGLIVITNQSGIGRGLLTVAEVEAIHAEMVRRLEAEGVHLERVYYCRHAPSEGCSCRKPGVALAAQAAHDFGFDLTKALVIGDNESDIEFGRNCGAQTILVRTGYGALYAPGTKADLVADNLLEAARTIRYRCGSETSRTSGT